MQNCGNSLPVDVHMYKIISLQRFQYSGVRNLLIRKESTKARGPEENILTLTRLSICCLLYVKIPVIN
jgi:hypothetical protein